MGEKKNERGFSFGRKEERTNEPRKKMTLETSGLSFDGREKSRKGRLAYPSYHRMRKEGSVLLRD